jgi:hypothetical protein
LFDAGEGTLPNLTLGELREYLRGEAQITFADDIVVAGRVVSSDRAGNFYNTFFVDDGTGAAEIMAGMPDLDAVFHPGQRVSIRARGLAVGWRDGAMQIGLPPEPGSRFATGYFYHPLVIGAYVFAERSVETVEPLDVKIGQLSEAMCGRLVRIAAVRADAESRGAAWARSAPVPVTGYVKFRGTGTGGAGGAGGAGTLADSISVVTSGYADWASARVPEREVTLTGILFYGRGEGSGNHFLLKLRNVEDIE